MESKLFAFVAIIALCSISSVRGDEWSDDELDFTVEKSEARFLNFNNTGLPDIRAILAFTLLGLLALVTFGPALLGAFGGGSSNNYGYNRNGFDYYDSGYQGYAEDGTQNQDQFYARSNVDDMVTKMLQLEQIFKKFEAEEDECKAYIACEAANVERLAENGPIVQKAHELF